MKRRPFPVVWLLALILLPALLASRHQTAPPTKSILTYIGTVQAVQTRTASFDIVTGVGYALRLMHVRTQPTTEMIRAGAKLAFGDLKAGDVVAVEGTVTNTGMLADRIEIKGPQGSQPERVP